MVIVGIAEKIQQMDNLIKKDEEHTDKIVKTLKKINEVTSDRIRILQNQLTEKDKRIAELQQEVERMQEANSDIWL